VLQNVTTKVLAKKFSQVPKPTLKALEGAEINGASGIKGGSKGGSIGRDGTIGSGRGGCHPSATLKPPLLVNTNITLDIGN
jgi:hypothetical protein